MRPLATWPNPVTRRVCVALMVLVIPLWFPPMFVWVGLCEGFPAAWDELSELGLLRAICKAWRGAEVRR